MKGCSFTEAEWGPSLHCRIENSQARRMIAPWLLLQASAVPVGGSHERHRDQREMRSNVPCLMQCYCSRQLIYAKSRLEVEVLLIVLEFLVQFLFIVCMEVYARRKHAPFVPVDLRDLWMHASTGRNK